MAARPIWSLRVLVMRFLSTKTSTHYRGGNCLRGCHARAGESVWVVPTHNRKGKLSRAGPSLVTAFRCNDHPVVQWRLNTRAWRSCHRGLPSWARPRAFAWASAKTIPSNVRVAARGPQILPQGRAHAASGPNKAPCVAQCLGWHGKSKATSNYRDIQGVEDCVVGDDRV